MSPRGKAHNKQMRVEAMQKITETATEIFSDYGYHGATIKQIAQVAGLSYGLVYHYFPSKEEIFRTLVDIALEKSSETIKKGLDLEGTAWEKLQNLSVHLVKNVLRPDSSRYFLIMFQALAQGKNIPGLMEHVGKHSEKLYSKLVPVIVRAQQSGEVMECDPVALTAAYLSFVQGLSFLVLGGGEFADKITPDILINTLRHK